ncbi:MAG: outer membrane beta-barrel protein [Syntrophales bacterium]|jgi:opacity protein-like surface antigen
MTAWIFFLHAVVFMKKLLLPILILIFCLVSAESYAQGFYDQPMRGFFSICGGVFVPKADINNYDTGPAVTLSGLTPIDKHFGIGVDLNFNSAKRSSDASYLPANRVETLSLEILVYLQPDFESRIQPYIAVGAGGYDNNTTNLAPTVTRSQTQTKWDDNNRFGSYGVLAKAGLRILLADNFFIGGFAKYFTNYHTIRQIYTDQYGQSHEYENTYDLGGFIVEFEAGYKF